MQKIVLNDLNNIATNIRQEAKLLSGKNLLISGGAGFIGSYIIATINLLNKKILAKPCRVISIDNYITGSRNNLLNDVRNSENFRFVEGDICLPLKIETGLDYIIHAAGLASPYYYQKYPLETIETAIEGAKNLLAMARNKKVKGMLFFSSSEIYGNPDPRFLPIPESYTGNVSSIGPRACYDESKRLAETLCMIYFQRYHVPTKIIRLFNVYGPGMKHDDYRVIPNFLYKGLRRKILPVHDKGTQTRTFCYVSDAVAGILRTLLLGKPGETYNIGFDKPEISMYELANKVTKLLNNNTTTRRIGYPIGYPAGEPQRRCPDITKARRELNYEPKIGLTLGLKRTIAWFKKAYNL